MATSVGAPAEVSGAIALEARQFRDLLEMLDLAFSSGGVEAHCAQYPLVLGRANWHRVRIVTEADRVVSAAVAWPSVCRLAGARIKVGFVSNVATHPGHRGRGLATMAVRACEDVLRDEGCVFAVLWSADTKFYGHLGYVEAGTEWDLAAPEAEAASGAVAEHVPGAEERASLYGELTRRRVSGVVHEHDALASLLGAPGLDFRVLRRGGGAVAFAIEGKGQDLGGFVHEWGGSLEGVEELLGAMAAETRTRPLVAMLPDEAVLLRRRLERRGFVSTAGAIGLFKVLDPWGLAAILREVLGRCGVRSIDVGVHADGLAFMHGSRQVVVPTQEVPRAVLGYCADLTRTDELSHSLGVQLQGILPLPFFLWGLDSC
ncbi:MAG: GNAT family N-acetyltransferase [Planctomycetota bacterium]